MSEAYFQRFEDIQPKEIFPGYLARLIHTPNNTINFLDVEPGGPVPMHKHSHHQCSFVIEGSFEMTVGEETQILTPGTFAIIPSNIPHGGRALSKCRILDIFSPVREDYR